MLQSKRLRLWAIERHDLLKNYHWANNLDIARLAGMQPYPKSAADVDQWWETHANTPSTKIFAIKTHDGDYLGNLELRDIELISGRAEVGIILGEAQAQGQGYGTEAVRLVCRFAFRELRLHRLFARVLEHNKRAQNTFRRCGFVQEGAERQAHFAGGRHWDVILYGLLRQEFKDKDEQNATD